MRCPRSSTPLAATPLGRLPGEAPPDGRPEPPRHRRLVPDLDRLPRPSRAFEPEPGSRNRTRSSPRKARRSLVRRSALEEVGVFDPDFFAYFEETDLCWRLWLAGWEVGFAADARVLHKLGATASALPSAFVQFHSFKNRICTLLKNAGTARLAAMLPFHLVLCGGLAVWYAAHRATEIGAAILRALGWNVTHFRGRCEAPRDPGTPARLGPRAHAADQEAASIRTLVSYARGGPARSRGRPRSDRREAGAPDAASACGADSTTASASEVAGGSVFTRSCDPPRGSDDHRDARTAGDVNCCSCLESAIRNVRVPPPGTTTSNTSGRPRSFAVARARRRLPSRSVGTR